MDDVEPIEWVNATLRLASAIILTVAGVFALIQYRKGLLRPRLPWLYSIGVGLLVAIWRWMVLATTGPHLQDFTDWLTPFINPISAAMYILIGVSVIVLTAADSRRRKN